MINPAVAPGSRRRVSGVGGGHLEGKVVGSLLEMRTVDVCVNTVMKRCKRFREHTRRTQGLHERGAGRGAEVRSLSLVLWGGGVTGCFIISSFSPSTH